MLYTKYPEDIKKNVKDLEKRFCDRYLFLDIMNSDASIEERLYDLKLLICDKFRDYFYISSSFAGYEHGEHDSGDEREFAVTATLYKNDIIYTCLYLDGSFYNYERVTADISILNMVVTEYED